MIRAGVEMVPVASLRRDLVRVRVIAMMRMRLHHSGIAAVPIAAILIAASIRIARAVVLAIRVGIELRTVAGIFDHFLRGYRACR
jgi:hypothetical protein